MNQSKRNGASNFFDIPHSLLTSSTAVKVFLDALAELIAEAFLEEEQEARLFLR